MKIKTDINMRNIILVILAIITQNILTNGSSICNKNVTQALVGFHPAPLYSPMVWSYDTLSLTNTSSCDIRVRPEVEIMHDSLAIGATDFDLKWYNPYTGSWSFITYNISSNGNALGIWGVGGDTTGIIIDAGTTYQVVIRIRFRPSANYGSYSAIWQTNEVDSIGGFIQNLDLDSTSMDYVNCSNFGIQNTSYSEITCFNANNGAASILSISNGSGEYIYGWNNGDTNNTINNLDNGIYYCIVTDMNWQQCSDSIGFLLSEPNPITFIIDSISNISTYGANDGYIYISSTGGSGNLNTIWTSNNGFSLNNEDIINLEAGVYYLEITDTNFCMYLDTIELTQPSSLWMNLSLLTNASCFDSCNGALNITANGGDSTYVYNWTGPNNFTSSNNNINNLCNGSYIITVYDGITTISDTFNIYQPQPITSNLLVDSILCHNGITQAEINVWGGTQPLIYNWSNGGSSYITTVQAGTHSISVTDQNGCYINQSFSITNPDSIISTTSSTDVDCFGGNNGIAYIDSVNGGNNPYSFVWSDGQTTSQANGLSAGLYFCTITDNNGCMSYASVNINEPNNITHTTSATDVSCYNYCDGTIDVSTFGGTPPYLYLWNNGQTTQTATNLCAGFYNVTITDNNNCSVINSAIINEPNPIFVNVWINGNSIEATSGFSSYQWYTSNGNIIAGATSNIFYPSSMGEYYVIVNDSNCEVNSPIVNYNINGYNNINNIIEIYPNPTIGPLTIRTSCRTTITVINSIGNQLIEVENNLNRISSTIIDLSKFAKGIYLLKINQNNQIYDYKILLQ